MPIRFTFEVECDTPEEAARLLEQLPGLARALPPAPIVGNLDQRAHDKADRSLRYESYKSRGGKLSFLGWANQNEPEDPTSEKWMGPGDQINRLPAVVK